MAWPGSQATNAGAELIEIELSILNTLDFGLLLMDVMTIADECDSQLKQTIASFTGLAADAA